jgi:hypothetical protein
MNKTFYFSLSIVLFLITIGATGCVDNDYKINTEEIDLEAQLGQSGVEVLLGFFEEKPLGEVLTDFADLDTDVEGNFCLGFDDAKSFNYEGVNMPNIGAAFPGVRFDMGIPSLDFSSDAEIEGLDIAPKSGSFSSMIPSGTINTSKTYNLPSISSDNEKITIDLSLPTQIKQVKTVWFGGANQPNGTPIEIRFDLGDLPLFCSDVTIRTLTIGLPARYKISSPDGEVSGSRLTISDKSVDLTTGEVVFTMYLSELSLSDLTPDVNGLISTDETLDYTLDYSITTRAGSSFSNSFEAPSIGITGQPVFKDALFVTNEIVVDAAPEPVKFDYSATIPEEVTKVSSINFASGSDIVIRMNEPALPFANLPELKLEFPNIFKFAADPHVSGSTLTVPVSELVDGFRVTLDRIELGSDGIPEGGKIDFDKLGYEIKASVNHTYPETEFLWSRDIENLDTDSTIDLDVDASALSISTVSVGLDLSFDQLIGDIDPIDLSFLTDELGDNVKANMVPPTITLVVCNPSGIQIDGSLVLTPKNAEGTPLTEVTADFVILPSVDGTTPRYTRLFFATADAPMPNDANTYIRITPENYDKLLEILPATIDVEFKDKAAPDVEHLIAVGKEFDFEMSYTLDAPLALRKGMDMAIEMTEGGLNDTFADLADYGIKASQIELAVEIDTSIPIQIGGEGDKVPTLDFLNKEGSDIEGLKTIVTGMVAGPGDGETGVKTSRLSVAIEVPNGGDFTTLSRIDQLKVRLPLDVTRTESLLNSNETIGGRIYISLPEGVNIDFGAL